MVKFQSSQGLKDETSLIVELVGLAGTGKTTLTQALSQRNENFLISPDLQLRKKEHLPIFIGHVPFLLPVILRRSCRSRWFTWDEIKAMVYLNGGAQIFEQLPTGKGKILLLDHGPIFKLATLNAFGPDVLKNQGFEMWWQKMYKRWACTLDIVIWLDAPDAILEERINSREQKHAVKERSEEEVIKFLALYRASYEQIMEKLIVNGGPMLLKFDTNQKSIDQIVDEVLSTCNYKSRQIFNQKRVDVLC